MKKLLTALLISLYLLQITFFVPMAAQDYHLWVIPIFFALLSVILSLINIGNAIISGRKNRADVTKQQSANRIVLVFKLLLIPFYLINFMIWLMLTAIFIPFAGNIIFLAIVVPMGIGFAYLTLAATSSYSIALLFSLITNKKMSLKQFIIHTICQLIFAADVIDQIYILKFTKDLNVSEKSQTEGMEV